MSEANLPLTRWIPLSMLSKAERGCFIHRSVNRSAAGKRLRTLYSRGSSSLVGGIIANRACAGGWYSVLATVTV